jgi:transposase
MAGSAGAARGGSRRLRRKGWSRVRLLSLSKGGPNLRAFVLYLRFAQAIPFERLARLMSDLLGLAISEGALANMLEASGSAVARQTSLICDRLLSGTILQSDQTSARVGEFLGARRPDFWVSDRFGAQMGWARTGHQACLAPLPLLRDVQYAIEAGAGAFAPAIKKLLKQAPGLRRGRLAIGHRRDRLKDSTLLADAAKLEATLDRLPQMNLFVFVTNQAVPPTNNGSEQALRPCVVFRKITNCFRSHGGATLYADVRSLFETARRRGIPILQSIRLTLDEPPLPVASSSLAVG